MGLRIYAHIKYVLLLLRDHPSLKFRTRHYIVPSKMHQHWDHILYCVLNDIPLAFHSHPLDMALS